MNALRRKYAVAALIFVIVGSNLATYLIFGYTPRIRDAGPAGDSEFPRVVTELPPEMELFTEVLERLSRSYVDPVDLDLLIRGAIDGMLESLDDPQTTLFDPQELADFLVQTSGSFSGVGVQITEADGAILVIEVFPGSPAEGAGLFTGDRINSAGGEPLYDQGVDRAVELLRGPVGTAVDLLVERPGAREPFAVTVIRQQIKVESVSSRLLEPGMGYIRIRSFDSSTGSDFASQLYALEEQGLERGLILDLRDNSGGLLEEALKVGELLVPEGEITRLVDRDGEIMEIHYSRAKPKDYPLVVLINSESASSSEIVAGALQDRQVALLVGEKTFGKGTVQQLDQLPDGFALRLTVAKYLTPSGRDLHGQGLEPDLHVEMPRALQYYRYFIPGRLEKGSHGDHISLLQEMLIELGHTGLAAGGYFNYETAEALKAFQRRAGLTPASGIFDELTWLKLREAMEEIACQRDPQLDLAREALLSPGLWAHRRGDR